MNKLDHAYQSPPDLDEGSPFKTDDVAYIKTVSVNGHTLYAVFDAEGTPLTVFDTRDVAFATMTQYDMSPKSTH